MKKFSKKKLFFILGVVFAVCAIGVSYKNYNEKNKAEPVAPVYKPAPTIPPTEEEKDIETDAPEPTAEFSEPEDEELSERRALQNTYEYIYDEDVDNSGYPLDHSEYDDDNADG